jgi:hypothetical protein
MTKTLIILPYNKLSHYRGTPNRAHKIHNSLTICNLYSSILYRPHLSFIVHSPCRIAIEHIFFYFIVFFTCIRFGPRTRFLCITQEAAIPFLFLPFKLHNRVLVDVHGFIRSEHRDKLLDKRKFSLGLLLLVLFESRVFRNGLFRYIVLTKAQERYIKKSTKAYGHSSDFVHLPFILTKSFADPHDTLITESKCQNLRLLYFGGAQVWQGLKLLDLLIMRSSKYLKYIYMHGNSVFDKYRDSAHLFGSLSREPPNTALYSYGLSLRSYHTRSSRFNFSSKIAFYIENNILPISPSCSNEAPYVQLFGGETFRYSVEGFEALISYLLSSHSLSYTAKLQTLSSNRQYYYNNQQSLLCSI